MRPMFRYIHHGLLPDEKVVVEASIELVEAMEVSVADLAEEGFQEFMEDRLTKRLERRLEGYDRSKT